MGELTDIDNGNYFIYKGLEIALERTKGSAFVIYHKVIEAQRHYFTIKGLSSESLFRQNSEKYLEEAMNKLYLGVLAIEQMWGVNNYLDKPTQGLPPGINNKLTNWQSDTTFMLSALFDQSLYQWRSFLEYYLKYLHYFCLGSLPKKFDLSAFQKYMDNNDDENKNEKGKLVFKYIRENVYCKAFNGEDELWGDLLRGLRNKTTHRGLIRPTMRIKENKFGYSLSWPTVQGLDYSRLAQIRFENNANKMIHELNPILYGFKLVTGPFKEGMFDSLTITKK